MLQITISGSLTRCAVLLPHHSHLLRSSSIVVKKDKFAHSSSFSTTQGKCIGQKSHNTYTAANGSNSRWEYKSNPWYSKPLGKLVGVLGTVVVLGFGTVLSESQEEKKPYDSETFHTIKKTFVKNEAQVGNDDVGTEKKLSDEEAIVSQDTRLLIEPSDSREDFHAEKLRGYEKSVRKARQILRRFAEEVGTPGMVVAVTVNGKQVWADGFGFADLENGVRCTPATVMRIASISKAMTMTAVAKLWEDGKLNLDAPVQKYIPSFPKKTYNGEEVIITTRQLISHQSGIRHYKLKDPQEKENNKKEKDNVSVGSKTDTKKEKGATPSSEDKKVSSGKDIKQEEIRHENKKCSSKKKEEKNEDDEFEMQEYYIKEEYETIEDSLKLFQDDELFFKPGKGYLYTTHGWTVVSAVVEGAAQKPFLKVAKQLFYELGLGNTYLDKSSPIIYNRASYYIRDKYGRLKNAPYVDNSYKWAGGGFLSTVGDLCKFGNVMLYASQQDCGEDEGDSPKLPGYLKASTVRQLWSLVDGTKRGWLDQGYGMGWEATGGKQSYQFCRNTRHHAYHSGGAVGASSILLVLPQEPSSCIPQGVVVALLANMQGVGMHKVALEIAELFEKSQ